MKTFDFKEAIKLGHSKAKTDWLKENQNNPITEEDFVREMKILKPLSNAKSHQGRHYTPSNLKKQYKYLKENFGFFPN